jgi:DNA-binding NarL/FixJ family response regulator
MPEKNTSPDFDDVDEIAVERALVGDGVALAQLTQAEQLEVVRRLTEQGESIADIAARLATSTATVSRRRAALCA